jgi:hypothetical protein
LFNPKSKFYENESNSPLLVNVRHGLEWPCTPIKSSCWIYVRHKSSKVKKSPVSLDELKLLQQALLFGEEDVKYLRMSHDILKGQTNEILDVWYGFVASTPQLVYFLGIKQPENQMVTI